MEDLKYLSITEAGKLLRQKKISSVELTKACLDQIEKHDGKLQAFITVTGEQALKDAEEADRKFAAGDNVTPLTGIPLAIKDILCSKGVLTTCASQILNNFIPPYDATVVKRLKDAGMVMVGKTNLDEFAMGASTENSGYFPTRNPWDTTRVPGGSSGGSAVAVAAGEALGSIGTDTGGSIRQPGALVNTVGVKPSYGRVSRYGIAAFASSLDQAGPFAHTAEDAAIILQYIAGRDPNDSTSVDIPVPNYHEYLTGNIKGLKIGIPREYWIEGTEPGVVEAVQKGIDTLKELGAEPVDISLPSTKYGVAAYYIIAPAEASANLARYDGVKYGYSAHADTLWDDFEQTRQRGFGAEVKRRIMLGTYALSAGYYDAYYLKAQKVRTLIKQDFDQAFEKCDVIVSPVSPTVAFPLGAKMDDPYQMYLCDVFTIPANLAGICGISVPSGFSQGLPVGLQILGKAFDEATIFKVADAFQRVTDYHTKRPAL